MRRTTSIDVTWPDGLTGGAVIVLAGQDLLTDAGGRSTVRDRWTALVSVDPGSGEVLGFDADRHGNGTAGDRVGDPGIADLADLVGASLRSGFGRRLASVLSEESESRSLRHSLLEDLAGAFLVSGYAPLRAGLFAADAEAARQLAPLQADICAGWATGGPVHRSLADGGRTAVPVGPPAPAIERADPSGWHPLRPLGHGTVRRRRLLDVTPAPDGRQVRVHSHFRDSYTGEVPEMVLHEYTVAALVVDGSITDVEVDPRVLPWAACPRAVASAGQVEGVAVAELARVARKELVGVATCTHLTSTIRLLADVRALTPPT